jgi:transposase-like protein
LTQLTKGILMTKEISYQDRQNYCIAWEASGKSKRSFCKAHGISPSTFQGWYHQYRTEHTSEMLFTPLAPKPRVPAIKGAHDVQCEIRFPNETQLFISLQESTLVSIIQGICHAATAIR